MNMRDYLKRAEENMNEKEETISVALFDSKAVESGKAKIIASDITLKEFDNLANKMGYKIKKKDTTLAGYYYANSKGDALVTYPPFRKKGSTVKAD